MVQIEVKTYRSIVRVSRRMRLRAWWRWRRLGPVGQGLARAIEADIERKVLGL